MQELTKEQEDLVLEEGMQKMREKSKPKLYDELEYELDLLYEKWLMENFPDEIHTKDDLIDKSCSGYRRDEFNKIVMSRL